MKEIIIIGYGNHGKVIAEMIEEMADRTLIGYLDRQDQQSKALYLGNDAMLRDVLLNYPDAEFLLKEHSFDLVVLQSH